MKNLLCAACLAGLGLFAAIAVAASATAPKLEAAIEAWLEDRDEIALPLLAEMAAAGDEDAMLLLGQIERRPGRLSAYLASLSPKELGSLLRAPGGFSGISWLKKVERQKALADALLHKTSAEALLEAIETLLKLGERGQAMRLILQQLNYGGFGALIALSQEQAFPEKVKFMRWMAASLVMNWSREAEHLPLARKILSGEALPAALKRELQGYLFMSQTAFMMRDQTRVARQIAIGKALYEGEFFTYDDDSSSNGGVMPQTWAEKLKINKAAAQLLMTARETGPIVRYCEKYCAQSAKMCARTVFGAIGGYYGFLQLQSPLEKLIPNQSYFQSKRFEADIVRSVSFHARTVMQRHPDKVDACAAGRLLAVD